MAASVATFDNNMARLIYELDDREIYNDVRSQIDVTETETNTVIDSEAVYGEDEGRFQGRNLGAASRDVIINAATGDTRVTWLGASCLSAYSRFFGVSQSWCEDLGGVWFGPDDPTFFVYNRSRCYLNNLTAQVVTDIISESDASCTVRILNQSAVSIDDYTIVARYTKLDRPIMSHEASEATLLTLMVRATDDISILNYGRRVMNLTWPLGQTQVQMQSLVDAYRDRHCEPVARLTMTLIGDDSFKVTQILTRKISDCVTVINTQLGLSAKYYINAIDFNKRVDGLLIASFILEEARLTAASQGRQGFRSAAEDIDYWVWDTSWWDGGDYWAP